MNKAPRRPSDPLIKEYAKARFEYHCHETLEVGLMLLGWEVKALRQGRLDFTGSYVKILQGRLVLLGARIAPLITAGTHIPVDPARTRTLLAHKREIARLEGALSGTGKTLIPLKAYWQRGRVKLLIGLASGKNKVDKRHDDQARTLDLEMKRIVKTQRLSTGD